MKELKYKVWDYDRGCFLEPHRCFLNGDGKLYYDGIRVAFDYEILPFTDTTGVKGKELYLGDIVKGYMNMMIQEGTNETVGEITYKNGCFMLQDRVLLHYNKIEKLGNVFENKNLLN